MVVLRSSRGEDHRIEDYYNIQSRLTDHSCGAGGTVVRGIRKSDSVPFAVKICELDSSREDKSQIQSLAQVNHPGIIKLVDWFETPQTLYVVMELAMGGEMFARIVERGRFTENQAAAAFRQILEAIGHMHDRGLVHCDLKPENILYEDDTERQIKIADFGFAQFLPDVGENGRLTRQLGTLNYTAPEVLSGAGYGTAADLWSLGVVLYILLSGIPPFGKTRNETDRQHRNRILTGTYRFYSSHFASVSQDAVDLIRKLLVVNPAERLSYRQVLEHPWIRGNAPDTQLPSEYILEIGSFNSRRGMYRLASHALAGLVSRFAQPDVIGAISAESNNTLSRVLQEGSIQPIVSLAYSNSVDDRKNACNAMANMALKEEYQHKLILEGGVRRLNQLACKEATAEAENSLADIKFFTAMALARIARNEELRAGLLDTGVNADARLNTLVALLHLAGPPHSSRIARQATEALALLAHDQKLHRRLVLEPGTLAASLPPSVDSATVAWGALLPLVRQSHALAPKEFRLNALEALRSICSASMECEGEDGSVPPDQLEGQLNKLYLHACELTQVSPNGSSSSASPPTPSAAASATFPAMPMSSAPTKLERVGLEVLQGLASLAVVLRREPQPPDSVPAQPQPWHGAQDLVGPVEVPELSSVNAAPPGLERTVSQRFHQLNLAPYRLQLQDTHQLLHDVVGRPLPRNTSWMDLGSMVVEEQPPPAPPTPGGPAGREDHMFDVVAPPALSEKDKGRVEEARGGLLQRRTTLISSIVRITGGATTRATVPATVNAVLSEMTDMILVLSDLVERKADGDKAAV